MTVRNKLLLASGALAAGLTAAPAHAETYFGGFIGSVAPEDFDINEADELSPDSAILFGGVIGHRFSDRLRGEVEASFWSTDADCAGKCGNAEYDVETMSILGNAWLDFGNGGGINPYVGGGIGAGNVSLDSTSDSAESWGLAYQVGAGIRFGGEGMTFDLGYRYRAVKADLDDHLLVSEDIDLNGHGIQIGATFNF